MLYPVYSGQNHRCRLPTQTCATPQHGMARCHETTNTCSGSPTTCSGSNSACSGINNACTKSVTICSGNATPCGLSCACSSPSNLCKCSAGNINNTTIEGIPSEFCKMNFFPENRPAVSHSEASTFDATETRSQQCKEFPCCVKSHQNLHYNLSHPEIYRNNELHHQQQRLLCHQTSLPSNRCMQRCQPLMTANYSQHCAVNFANREMFPQNFECRCLPHKNCMSLHEDKSNSSRNFVNKCRNEQLTAVRKSNQGYENNYDLGIHKFETNIIACPKYDAGSQCNQMNIDHQNDFNILAMDKQINNDKTLVNSCHSNSSAQEPLCSSANLIPDDCSIVLTPDDDIGLSRLQLSAVSRQLLSADSSAYSRTGEVVADIASMSVSCLPESGWYYGKLSWKDAQSLLREASVGAFLLRTSSNSRYSHALSVQTSRGPTSVRIQRHNTKPGGYSLDCDPESAPVVLPSVHHLLQHYVDCSVTSAADQHQQYQHMQHQQLQQHQHMQHQQLQSHLLKEGCAKWQSGDGKDHVWLDAAGEVVATIKLSQPFRHEVPTLKHSARLAINNSTKQQHLSCVPNYLRKYLQEYPFHF